MYGSFLARMFLCRNISKKIFNVVKNKQNEENIFSNEYVIKVFIETCRNLKPLTFCEYLEIWEWFLNGRHHFAKPFGPNASLGQICHLTEHITWTNALSRTPYLDKNPSLYISELQLHFFWDKEVWNDRKSRKNF